MATTMLKQHFMLSFIVFFKVEILLQHFSQLLQIVVSFLSINKRKQKYTKLSQRT